MHTGHYISGAGHLGLIGWLLLGGLFAAEPEPFEMTEVSVISGADFEAMIAAQQAPQSATEVAQPAAPDETSQSPDVASQPDDVIEQPAPVQTETPPEDAPPDVTDLAPLPDTQVEDTPPDLQEPLGDVAVLVPEIAPEAAPRPVERVAPEPVAQPDPEAAPDPLEQDAVTPDAQGETTEQDTQDATAPEEATTEIVTEATKAPAASIRPPGNRPATPARQAAAPDPQTSDTSETENPSQTDEAPVSNDDVMAALQAAQDAPAAPSGPPLSAGEKESLRVAVSSCWNVGSLSSEALQTTVVVSLSMNKDGTPIVGTISMDNSSGGSASAARQAFEAARRAIIRCGARGYDLPAEKYGQWQEIEMTFNPERMRVK